MRPSGRNGPRYRRRAIGRKRGSSQGFTALVFQVRPTEGKGSWRVCLAGDVAAALPSSGNGCRMDKGQRCLRMPLAGAGSVLAEPVMGLLRFKGSSPMMLPLCSMTAAALESPYSEAFRCLGEASMFLAPCAAVARRGLNTWQSFAQPCDAHGTYVGLRRKRGGLACTMAMAPTQR